MAEQELPFFMEAVATFDEKMREHLHSLDDFGEAIKEGGTADEIVDNWQARTLIRTMPEDIQEQ